MRADVVVLAGGVGQRFSSHPKQFLEIAGKPLFVWTLERFLTVPELDHFYLVFPSSWLGLAEDWLGRFSLSSRVRLVAGGSSRQQSSLSALRAITSTNERVLIHDACRPVLSDDFLARIRSKIVDSQYRGWVPVVPLSDSLKRVEDGVVCGTVPREQVYRVQTPQIFDRHFLLSEMEKSGTEFTDDASILQAAGETVGVFEGDSLNIKLTFASELPLLESLLLNCLSPQKKHEQRIAPPRPRL